MKAKALVLRNNIFTFVLGLVIGAFVYYIMVSRLGSVEGHSTSTIDSLKRMNDSLIALNIRSIAKIMASNDRLDSLKEDYDSISKLRLQALKIRYRTIYRTDTITINNIFEFFTGQGADTSTTR